MAMEHGRQEALGRLREALRSAAGVWRATGWFLPAWRREPVASIELTPLHLGVMGSLTLVLLLAALVGAAVAAQRMMDDRFRVAVASFDRAAAVQLHGLACPCMDWTLGTVSWLGEKGPMIAATGSIFVYLLWRRRFNSAVCAGVSMLGTELMW